MKKSLIALAALAASGAVFAQSSVTLFGVVDLAYERVKTNSGTISGIAPSSNSSSRLGFRGVEDLGGGMSASFWLEAALSPNSGFGSSGTSQTNQSTTIAAGGLTFNRRSTVSLSGGFGELRIGRDYVPSFWNYTIFDPFGTNSVGATMASYTGGVTTFVRASNSIGYFLPGNLGGFYGQAMYAFGNRASTESATGYAVTRNTQDNGRYIGLRVGYGQGPFNTAVAYGRTTYASGTNTASLLGSAATPIGNYTDLNWGGSYTFGSIKAMAQLSRQKYDDAIALGNQVTVKGWGLGADWGVGAGDVLLSYSRVSLDGVAGTTPKASKWALGYVHNLSKRTAVYGYYAHVSNKGGAAATAASFSSGGLGAVGGAANVNASSSGIDVGLRHAF
ncbi:MAG TPA: porin [Ramlibacter sp.]|nr:porin [Ramlibacter sp.]